MLNSKILQQFSLHLGKHKNFIRDQFVKFFICFTDDDFLTEHYYIIMYLILCFRDNKSITEDQCMAIIYVLYSLIIDDHGSCSGELYRAVRKTNNFDNFAVQAAILLSGEVLKVCKKENFQEEWENYLPLILQGKENFKEKQYLLKEMKYTNSIIDERKFNRCSS